MRMGRHRALVAMIFAAIVGTGCSRPPASAAGGASAGAPEAYVPGLGEIMTLQQMRHAKLWLAGQAGNWELADYELDELGEGFDDVVKFHPTHKDSPVAPKDAIPKMIPQPLADLRAAVEKKDVNAFGAAYDSLTEACNNCHKATNFGFNRVQRPTGNPFLNQLLSVLPK